MATVDIFTDPPAEQLYDELLSRLWAVHQLADFPAADITQPETTRRLAAMASTAVNTLRSDGDPARDLQPHHVLHRGRLRLVG